MLKSKYFFKILLTIIIISISIYFLSINFLKISYLDNSLSFKKIDKSIISTDKEDQIINEKKIKLENELFETKKEVKINKIPEKIKEIIIVKKGDTFSGILDLFFKDKKTKQEIINLFNSQIDLRSLKVGQNIFFYRNINNIVLEIILPINFETDLIVYKDESGKFLINKKQLEITNQFSSVRYEINTSIFEDGKNNDVPLPILAKVIQLYSFDIDFQRDIRKGNSLEIYYESFYNKERDQNSFGKIYYTNLFLENKELEYFIFKTKDGFFDYFNKKGKNVKKALLKTPIDGARLSSSFGMRKHPISGYNKMHKGTDFAAPTGTPVYAGGNGRIEYLGRNGSYGKYIRIRHSNSYKTAYAHLSGYKKGLSKGSSVIQGDIIGYVGSTGKSTGPHLHYEIIYKNEQMDPRKLNLPSGKTLEGEELVLFENKFKKIYSDFLFALYE